MSRPARRPTVDERLDAWRARPGRGQVSSGLVGVLRQGWPLVVAVAVVLAVWAVVSASGTVSHRALPSPAAVWSSLVRHVADGSIPTAAGKTLLRLVVGFGAAIVFGTLLGFVMARSSVARRGVGGLVLALRAIPPIAWLPLAALWFGLNERAVVFVEFVGAVPSVTLATVTSVRQVPPLLEDAGRTLGARGWGLFRTVSLPAALPGYVAGLQQAWAFAWSALLAGELITRTTQAFGLGHAVLRAQAQNRAPLVFAVLAVIIAIGLVVDLIVFRAVDRRIRNRRGMTVGTAA